MNEEYVYPGERVPSLHHLILRRLRGHPCCQPTCTPESTEEPKGCRGAPYHNNCLLLRALLQLVGTVPGSRHHSVTQSYKKFPFLRHFSRKNFHESHSLFPGSSLLFLRLGLGDLNGFNGT